MAPRGGSSLARRAERSTFADASPAISGSFRPVRVSWRARPRGPSRWPSRRLSPPGCALRGSARWARSRPPFSAPRRMSSTSGFRPAGLSRCAGRPSACRRRRRRLARLCLRSRLLRLRFWAARRARLPAGARFGLRRCSRACPLAGRPAQRRSAFCPPGACRARCRTRFARLSSAGRPALRLFTRLARPLRRCGSVQRRWRVELFSA